MRRPALALVLSLLLTPAPAAHSASVTVTYTYDSAGRLARVDYGNGKGFVYKWDSMGNLTARTPLPPSPAKRRSVRMAAAPAPSPSQYSAPK